MQAALFRSTLVVCAVGLGASPVPGEPMGKACALLGPPRVEFDRSTSDSPAPWPPAPGLPAPPTGARLAPGTYWVHLRAVNPTSSPVTCVFQVDPFAPLAELAVAGSDGPVARTGWLLPLPARAMANPQPVLPAVLAPGVTPITIRLWVPNDPLRLAESTEVTVTTLETFVREARTFDHLNGIYGGIMVAVVLYNLFLFLSLRERLYLLYVAYATCFGLIWLIRARMGLVFLWPDWPRWDAQAHYFATGLAIVAGNAFTAAFLELRTYTPRLAAALRGISVVTLATLAAAVAQRFTWIERPLAILALAACAVYVTAGLRRLGQGSLAARYFLAATGMVVVGTVAYTLAFFGVLPVTFFTANAAQLGSAAEMVLLAFALGNRIRALRQQKLQAEEMSRTDALTGLANRRLLDRLMDEEWRRAYRQGTTLAMLLVDVDHFKAYNDSLGHQSGDDLLRRLALEIAALCRRPGDVAARYGGEEFVLVLPGVSGEQASRLAERLRRRVEEQRWLHPASPLGPWVTVSCGVAAGRPAEGTPVADLFAAADRALYVAKNEGRNRVSLAAPRPVSNVVG